MPAQIIVTRMSKADTEKKVADLKATDVLEVKDHDGRATCIVISKINIVNRGPELDRAYQMLQAVADADSAVGAERRKEREAKEAAAAAAQPKPKPAAKPPKP
jgi:hypothetical protein